MAKTITSTNSEFIFSIPDIFPNPIPLQGYSADDAFTNEAVDIVETRMGVDGNMSAGYTPAITPITITLQADSPSIAAMDEWAGAVKSAREVVYADAIVVLPGPGKQYNLTKGTLKTIKQLPDVKKVVEPQTYVIHFQNVDPSDI